jgi:pimeloyl-ACP methyl ester carboxylesterase
MERTVRAGDVDLAVIEAGSGGRPLLLVHGFGGAAVDFEWHLDELAAAGWHVVAPDLRGHGASGRPPAGYTFDHLAGDVVGLADSLGWDRFALLGHSMGGVVAQHVALLHPHRLSALVLMDTTAGQPPVDPDLVRMAIAIAREEGMEALLRAMKELGGPLDTPAAKRLLDEVPGWEEQSDRKLLACSPTMYAEVLEAWLELPERDLSPIRVPTLVIAGEQDEPFLAATHAVARMIEGARVEVLLDAGHSPQVEAPEAWRKTVTTFLDEVVG